MAGKMIEPLKLKGNENIRDFVEYIFGASGYNARRLAEACEIYARMLRGRTTVCLTLAGAMTPIGMSGPIIDMMKSGFIDFIISTGANLYHDMHRPLEHPIFQGEVFVDDGKLNRCGISRIYDIFIEDERTLLATDRAIMEMMKTVPLDRPISTAELHHHIGLYLLEKAPHPAKSFLAQAAKYGVPVYTSSPGDSSIGMNLAGAAASGRNLVVDPNLDVLETTAIVMAARKNGAVEVGGGSPKNFYMQTQPMLKQILNIDKGGHDYFIQLTADAPHWGGLSGATPQEAKSWGKIRSHKKNNVVVYSCASITFPLLCQYARLTCRPRPLKKLYEKRETLLENLKELALQASTRDR